MKPMIRHSTHLPNSRNGFAVVVLLAFLVLILMLCIATTSAVIWERREAALIEKKQLARLGMTTNTAPTLDSAITK